MRFPKLIAVAAVLLTASCSSSTASEEAVEPSTTPEALTTPTTTPPQPSQSDGPPEISYKVGDIGPGGGVIFLVAEVPFACGPGIASKCRYLEVSPIEAEVHRTWINMPVYPVEVEVDGASSGSVGGGMQNSLDIAKYPGATIEDTAAIYALEYEHGGQSDWFLPSMLEFNELCKYAKGQPTGDYGVLCGYEWELGVKPPNMTAIYPDFYWTSSEDIGIDANSYLGNAWAVNGHLGSSVSQEKVYYYRVRPIRAF